MTRALVLGGGGPVGIGWETGLLAGLDAEGVSLRDADFLLGTSAGAIVGAQVAVGRSFDSMLAGQRRLGERERAPMAAPPVTRIATPITRFYEHASLDEFPSQAALQEMGRWALAAPTMSEAEELAGFGFLAGIDEWPQRDFAVTAIDAADGSFVAWRAGMGVPFGPAVASSCAAPGVYPPVTINGRRYYDGGLRTATNADLAAGHDTVVVVSVTVATAAPQTRALLDRELRIIREAGGTVELIAPDDASIAVFGPNLMDPGRRADAAEAGYRQGRVEADRIGRHWR